MVDGVSAYTPRKIRIYPKVGIVGRFVFAIQPCYFEDEIISRYSDLSEGRCGNYATKVPTGGKYSAFTLPLQ